MSRDQILLISLLMIILSAFSSCGDKDIAPHPYEALTKEYFDSLADDAFRTNSQIIRDNIIKIAKKDADGTAAERHTRAHYSRFSTSPAAFFWIDRHGVSSQADTLMACLDSCAKEGVSEKALRLQRIRDDVETVRNLAFSESQPEDEEINMVFARLEYNLTRAFLKYAVGQRYGFLNPKQILNKLDVRDSASARTTYRQLFDIPMHIAGQQTYYDAMLKIRHDSVGWYLRQAMNHSPFYFRLRDCLAKPQLYDRNKVLLNMERARWKTNERPEGKEDYIVINIPAQHLWAVRDGISALDAKIVCGSKETKTPLLYSAVKRMDLNPQWIIPMSIRKKDVARHAGNAAYFDSRHYFARNKKTGQKLTGGQITWSVITSPDWSVVQAGGEGNALGRIIFRFDNNFAVYLHDTSSKHVFSRSLRDVSHGCIRVEKPYELALFVLKGKDEALAEKIKYSMEADLSLPDCKKSMIVHSIPVEPQLPIFIIYYTLFSVPGGSIESFPDVYGYDAVMMNELQKHL